MIEAGVSAVVAIIAAGAALTNKIHNRIKILLSCVLLQVMYLNKTLKLLFKKLKII
jgi:hypothetical protein